MEILHITKENFEGSILNAKQPVLVDFWADWCGPCKMLAPVLEEIAEEGQDFQICKINVDEQPELAVRYQVMSIPTLILFRDGKEVRRSVGFQPKEEVLNLMQ